MKSSGRKPSLTSYDEIFSTEASRQQEQIQSLVLSELHPFKDHPFRVLDDDRMMETVESVKEYGVLVPIIARPMADGGYEIVAGHRRCHASRRAGVDTMPCIVRQMDDDTATILMVDSNIQRENILPSERAQAYKMKLEAIRRKAGRPAKTAEIDGKNNSRQVVGKLESADEVGQVNGESGRTIQRYIRLTNLVPPLLQMVDDGRIAFSPAVELSYLTRDEQAELWDLIGQEDATPSLSQSLRMKQISREAKLTPEVLYAILTEEKPNQKEQVRIKTESLRKYFPRNYSAQQMEREIIKLLEARYRAKDRGNR
mgnify:CR=1 FL=1